jgi:hypothetical protein
MGERTELKAERLRELRAYLLDKIYTIPWGARHEIATLIDAELQRRSDSADGGEHISKLVNDFGLMAFAWGRDRSASNEAKFDAARIALDAELQRLRASRSDSLVIENIDVLVTAPDGATTSVPWTVTTSRSDSAEGGGAEKLLREIDEYLSGHPQNAIYCGSKLHRDVQSAIAFIERGGEKVERRAAWLVVADGEGSYDSRVCYSHADIVQFLWEQCGPDYTGKEEDSRNNWFTYFEDGDHWQSRDGEPQFRAEFGVGETGHILIQRFHTSTPPPLTDSQREADALDARRYRWLYANKPVANLLGVRGAVIPCPDKRDDCLVLHRAAVTKAEVDSAIDALLYQLANGGVKP